jgi:hypothetical protein
MLEAAIEACCDVRAALRSALGTNAFVEAELRRTLEIVSAATVAAECAKCLGSGRREPGSCSFAKPFSARVNAQRTTLWGS